MTKSSKWFWVIGSLFRPDLGQCGLAAYISTSLEVNTDRAQYDEMHGDVMAAARDFLSGWAIWRPSLWAVWGGSD